MKKENRERKPERPEGANHFRCPQAERWLPRLAGMAPRMVAPPAAPAAGCWRAAASCMPALTIHANAAIEEPKLSNARTASEWCRFSAVQADQ